MQNIDHTMPDGKWEFDENVTKVFENMLERSIPQYHLMRELCFKIGSKFIKKNTDIVDLGCSKGDSMSMFVNEYGAYNRHIGIEISPPMLKAVRERFKNLISANIVSIQEVDLRENFPFVSPSLIMSILTIQFTPIEYRQTIIQKVYDSLHNDGAFLFVEKIIGETAQIDNLLVNIYLSMKGENGYNDEEIKKKKYALEGVLVPATAKWNVMMLESAGFKKIDCFWRCLNFAGWVAIK